MKIVLPIFFFALSLGLFVKRINARHWIVLGAFVALVIAYNYFRN